MAGEPVTDIDIRTTGKRIGSVEGYPSLADAITAARDITAGPESMGAVVLQKPSQGAPFELYGSSMRVTDYDANFLSGERDFHMENEPPADNAVTFYTPVRLESGDMVPRALVDGDVVLVDNAPADK